MVAIAVVLVWGPKTLVREVIEDYDVAEQLLDTTRQWVRRWETLTGTVQNACLQSVRDSARQGKRQLDRVEGAALSLGGKVCHRK
jgi:hypothetical protein